MIDARGALVQRQGRRSYVLQDGFVDSSNFRLLPGASYNKSKKLWSLPVNVLPREISKAPRGKTPSGLVLRPYQNEAVQFIRDSYGGALIATDVGLGKTIISLQYLTTTPKAQGGPFVICGPLAALGAWVGPEADPAKHYGLNVAQLKTRKPEEYWPELLKKQREENKPQIHGVFLNYEIAEAWQTFINNKIKPACIICDESHELRNVRIKARQALAKLCHKNRVHARILLSATPIVNHLIDLYSQFDLIQAGLWGNYESYAVRYCNGRQGEYSIVLGGETNRAEFKQRLNNLLFRRSRFDGSVKLPPFWRSRVNIAREALDPEPLKEYQKMLVDLRGTLFAQGKSQQGAELQQANAALKLLSEAKRPAALEQALALCNEHHKTLIVSWYQDTTEWLAKKLEECGVLVFGPITSKTSKTKRDKAMKALRDAPNDSLPDQGAAFVATLGTSAMSTNDLVCCSGALSVDLWYVPMTMLQAEGRLHREGQKSGVDWRYLVARETADDRMFEHLTAKADAISTSLGDDSALSLCETLGGRNEEDDLKKLFEQLALVDGDGEL